jgi:hypothetical protein
MVGIFEWPNQPTVTCAVLAENGKQGLIMPEECQYLPERVAEPCLCEPIELLDFETSLPVTTSSTGSPSPVPSSLPTRLFPSQSPSLGEAVATNHGMGKRGGRLGMGKKTGK